MRHIKTYEKFDDDFVFLQQAKFWKNIFQKGDKLYINLYKLSDEMFEFANKESSGLDPGHPPPPYCAQLCW